ncbi:helix-turn-helix domain-containing protein [Streptomyces sp. NPDC005931]|uniref:AraC-like ligand-binding domain-containing protein n=1 Tax=Streptomyces sp. NPDC005931 TaxID=3364737 RepID=UPI0036A7C2CB
MTPVLDTASIPPRDREEVLLNVVRETMVAVDIEHTLPAPDISARIRLGEVGPLGIFSARATAATVRRTGRLARQDQEPIVLVGLQVTGTSVVVQNGRECLLRPGDFALYESTSPYTLLYEEGVDHHFLRFPRAALALPDRSLRDITAVSLGPGNPLARLAFTYFSQLALSDELHRGAHAGAAFEPSVELLRGVVASHRGDTGSAKASSEATLGLRITQYIREHLADPDLSAARIAAAHGISVRHLYVVLSRSGISLGDWIRTRRLAERRRELAGPGGRLRTIAAIARSWGFVDATHFSKVFKQAYGVTPRDWRDHHHLPSRSARDAPRPARGPTRRAVPVGCDPSSGGRRRG